eukprot:TRINITY_DN6579_c0_g1_i5.p1 TRINITY_DN6579_c0_g1~~TRINITY_DN6579_c0_g1_i5.p1  ORF type:complete len:375 (+),score=93.49 TRINITY_DN6579_c0_g1_i5:478-1602(+)
MKKNLLDKHSEQSLGHCWKLRERITPGIPPVATMLPPRRSLRLAANAVFSGSSSALHFNLVTSVPSQPLSSSPITTAAGASLPSKVQRNSISSRSRKKQGTPEAEEEAVVADDEGAEAGDDMVVEGAAEEGIEGEEGIGRVRRRKGEKPAKGAPSRDMERRLWQQGFRRVVGVDEAGRGPLAGPVVAAACVIPEDVLIPGINDSKKLKEEEREQIFQLLTSEERVQYAATLKAMTGCVTQLLDGYTSPTAASSSIPLSPGTSTDYILIDGNRLPSDLPPGVPAEPLIKGDAECHVIAAASILAKVTRDRIMNEYDKQWPEYGFKQHKGYGTAAHMAALLRLGPCPIHRRSFAPIKDWVLMEKDSPQVPIKLPKQ